MELKNTALLVLGHGSSKHQDSSASVRMHAEALSKSGDFSEVHCAFLKEDPFIEDAFDKIMSENICIVPDFLAEGYFTRQVIPAKLNLKAQAKCIRYAPPVGTHPLMSELMRHAADGLFALPQTGQAIHGRGDPEGLRSRTTSVFFTNQWNTDGRPVRMGLFLNRGYNRSVFGVDIVGKDE